MNKTQKDKKALERNKAKLGACAICTPNYISHKPSTVQKDGGVVVHCRLGGQNTIPQLHIADPQDCNRVKRCAKKLATLPSSK